MKRYFLALLAGALFGAGLAVSGMMDPSRVRGFLDVLGAWDPTLIFVMGGAVLVMIPIWKLQSRMDHPLADSGFHLPDKRKIDVRLLGGSAMFGAGWGLSGLCPGPAIGSLAIARLPAAIFVAAMIAGMVLFRIADRFAGPK